MFNLDPANLLASLMFGLVGTAYFLYGKKQSNIIVLVTGIALMVFPYFITELWKLIVIGIVLIFLPKFIKIES